MSLYHSYLYNPFKRLKHVVVCLPRLELGTPWLKVTCSTNWATGTYMVAYYRCGYKFYSASSIIYSIRTICLFPTILHQLKYPTTQTRIRHSLLELRGHVFTIRLQLWIVHKRPLVWFCFGGSNQDLVQPEGLEPSTSRLSGEPSNHLMYGCKYVKAVSQIPLSSCLTLSNPYFDSIVYLECWHIYELVSICYIGAPYV